jgi:hypothetical protein
VLAGADTITASALGAVLTQGLAISAVDFAFASPAVDSVLPTALVSLSKFNSTVFQRLRRFSPYLAVKFLGLLIVLAVGAICRQSLFREEVRPHT